MSKEPPDDVTAAYNDAHKKLNYHLIEVTNNKGKWMVLVQHSFNPHRGPYVNGWLALLYKQGAGKWEYTHVVHVAFPDFYPKTGDIIEHEYTVLHNIHGAEKTLEEIVKECMHRTDDEIKQSFLDYIASSSPDDFTEEHMERYEEGYYRWKGPKECIEPIRRQLFNHWRKCAGEKRPLDSDIQIYCMHDDAHCMDQRYVTTNPESWEAPAKNSKEKSSCEK